MVAAALVFASSLIHAAMIAIHFEEYWLFGVCFAVAAVAQALWTAQVYKRRLDRRVLVAGAAGMNSRRFMLATTAGAILWVPTLVLVGFYAAGLLASIPWLNTVLVWGSVAFFVIGTAYGAWRYRQEMRKPVEERSEAAST